VIFHLPSSISSESLVPWLVGTDDNDAPCDVLDEDLNV